jgi:hypothetical protein
MEWFSRKTSIAGIEVSNWILVIVVIVVIWIIYSVVTRAEGIVAIQKSPLPHLIYVLTHVPPPCHFAT